MPTLGKSTVSITPEMLDKISQGACLITPKQAHLLMSLSVSRSQLPEGYEDLIADLTREINEIWVQVFGVK